LRFVTGQNVAPTWAKFDVQELNSTHPCKFNLIGAGVGVAPQKLKSFT